MENPKLQAEFIDLIENNKRLIYKLSQMYCDTSFDMTKRKAKSFDLSIRPELFVLYKQFNKSIQLCIKILCGIRSQFFQGF